MVSLFSTMHAFGQLSEVENSYANYNKYNLQEKIYVHTDRSFYLCGEVLWFKAYLTNAANNQPFSLSKVVYVELLNNLHQPVLQGKIAMENGVGNGSFYLPFSVTSGNYVLRAYTNWMKNFSQDYFFEKNISIINSSNGLDSSMIHESVNYNADFFPEGGNLVNGLESEIAFKVSDNKNKGAEYEGVIIDQLKDTVARFESLQFGMGHFTIKPETGKQYTAIINLENGTSIRKNLPEAYNTGYVMHLADNGSNDLKISIHASLPPENAAQNIYIIIQNNHQINFAQSKSIENNEAVVIINKDSLKEGVSRITVFDANKQPLCERLYFRRPQNKMVITAKSDKENYQLRNKVIVDITTSNQSGDSLTGNLSAAVYRLDNLHEPDKENIFSYLWLSSNLRGTIEDPDYYFKNENDETNEALDNLMLTQGWRKFNWENVLQNKTPAFSYVPEYRSHIITGKITNDITKKPAPDVEVYLSVPGRRIQLRVCISDSNGLVHFEMKDFFGANQIVVQTNTNIDSIYHLEILSPFSEKISENILPAFYIGEKYKDDLLSENMDMEVQNTYHEDQLEYVEKPEIDTTPFYFHPYKTYVFGDYVHYTTMEEAIREYVNEASVRKNGSKFRIAMLNVPAFALQDVQPTETKFQKDPLVLLDGVPVFDIDKIMAYDPSKIEKLEVVAERYYFGPITADGIMSYTTYKANLEDFKLDPHDLILDYEGLQQQRIFYSPEYTNDDERMSRLPDFRDLLFWTPTLTTNVNGKGGFSFYTSDIPGKYLVVIQGLSSKGFAGSSSFIFNVAR